MDKFIPIRDFINQMAQTILSLIRILLVSKWGLKKAKKSGQNNLVILGNGPSLKEFVQGHLSFLENKAVVVVNFFARTEFFEIIKPDYYVIISPEYFLDEEKKEFAEDRVLTFKTLANKTQWPMELIVPALARNRKEKDNDYS